jgi:hypothetical protein
MTVAMKFRVMVLTTPMTMRQHKHPRQHPRLRKCLETQGQARGRIRARALLNVRTRPDAPRWVSVACAVLQPMASCSGAADSQYWVRSTGFFLSLLICDIAISPPSSPPHRYFDGLTKQ